MNNHNLILCIHLLLFYRSHITFYFSIQYIIFSDDPRINIQDMFQVIGVN